MNSMTNNRTPSRRGANHKTSNCEQAAIRPGVLVTLLMLVVLALGVMWLRRTPATVAKPVAVSHEAAVSGLSDASRAVLQRLNSPVEIRLYAILNDSQAAAPRRAYAERIAALLAEYQNVGAGNIVVKRIDSTAGAGPAAADGLEPLRLGRGNPGYLGLAVVCQGQKAVLPSLAPEWEAALEFDLSRAIARVVGGAPGEVVMNPAPVNVVSTDELLRVVPEAETLPLPEAAQKVKAAGLEEFKAAVTAMQAELAQAQKRLADAQKEGPAAEQAAREKLQQLQSEQNEKLAEISGRMQGRLSALQQLKRTSQ